MKSTVINLSLSFAIVVTGLAVLVTPALAQGPVIVRISVSENGTQSNNDSHDATISADGRYVAFSSFANNLVVGDTGHRDIFVHDRQTGQLERVSVTSDGGQANNNSFEPMISANGQFVVFASEASNLVPDDSGSNNPNQPATGFTDVFVYDRVNATIERVSIDSDGNAGNDDSFRPAISADGRFVVFRSAAEPGSKRHQHHHRHFCLRPANGHHKTGERIL